MRRTLGLLAEPLVLLSSLAATLVRPWIGWRGRPAAKYPAQAIIFYEFEACPYCKIARETLSALQLEADIRPCPKGGNRFRPEVKALGGKAMFPYMIDPNTNEAMYESADISRYLYKTYGERRGPVRQWPLINEFNVFLSFLSLQLRLWAGLTSYQRTKDVSEPLAFWGVEAGPQARLVREMLCALEIPYRLHTERPQGKGGLLLSDPNTGLAFRSSFGARHYLLRTYA